MTESALVRCVFASLLLAAGAAGASPEVDRLAAEAAGGDRAALDALVERARSRKDADAEYALGLMAYEAKGLERNPGQAFRLVERAAAKGHAEACNTLGYFHQYGIGTPVDLAQALAWFRRGAEAGSAGAQNNLGWFHEHGIGLGNDPAAAAAWYLKAVEQGLPGAHVNLANLYEKGLGVERNPVVAAALYEAAFARGVTSAALRLARLQEARGKIAEAVANYVAAAKGGIAEAELPAGRLLVSAATPGRDVAQGVKWLVRAAAPESRDKDKLDALRLLAGIFATREGVPADAKRSADYSRRAALLGDGESAFLYAGYLEAQATDDPAPWYRQAAKEGHAEAQFRIAKLLQARGGESRAESVEWFRKAAAQGHLGAALQLGLALEGGIGVAASPAEAIQWYEKSAAANDPEALFRLGNLYDRGGGKGADFGRARDYYSRAATLGHAGAAEVLKRMVGAPALEPVLGDPFKGMR